MKLRTYLGLLLTVLLVITGSYLATLNSDLLQAPFAATATRTFPLWTALVGVFLLGFLPVATVLFIQSLERDLAKRRRRRTEREAESLDGRFRRALDLRADGQHHRASALLEEVLTERPDDFGALSAYGEVLRLLGRHDEALEVHRRASVLYPQSVGLLYELAEDYEARGEDEVAAEVRNRIVRDFPEHALRALRAKRNHSMAAGEWEEASTWHDRIDALLTEVTSADMRDGGIARGLAYQRALTLLEKDQLAEGTAALRTILESEPRFVPAGIVLGEAELMRGDEDKALRAWRQGYAETGSPVYLQRIEDHFIEREDPEQAIATLRGLIAETDNDTLLRFFLGRFYMRVEMLDEALKILVSIAEPMDASPTYHYLLGRLHYRRQRSERALRSFTRAFDRLGIARTRFVCRCCGRRSSEWHDRCPSCASWNSVEVDVEAERLSPEALGLVERPTWGPDTTASENGPRAFPHGAPAPPKASA